MYSNHAISACVVRPLAAPDASCGMRSNRKAVRKIPVVLVIPIDLRNLVMPNELIDNQVACISSCAWNLIDWQLLERHHVWKVVVANRHWIHWLRRMPYDRLCPLWTTSRSRLCSRSCAGSPRRTAAQGKILAVWANCLQSVPRPRNRAAPIAIHLQPRRIDFSAEQYATGG